MYVAFEKNFSTSKSQGGEKKKIIFFFFKRDVVQLPHLVRSIDIIPEFISEASRKSTYIFFFFFQAYIIIPSYTRVKYTSFVTLKRYYTR